MQNINFVYKCYILSILCLKFYKKEYKNMKISLFDIIYMDNI